uniref:NAD-dependent epimerase/dehydratase domain-containing protein n=1 Tax=Salix viminalis TaxID=40686 RepID=A0A6N2LD34_SALVM
MCYNYFRSSLCGLSPTHLQMSGQRKVVCVTGGSGYIASWLVKLLLHRGYTVKATVRDLSDPKRTEHLLDLDGAKERLHLFKANLVEEGSFDPVVDGCESVFHVASPVFLGTNDPHADLIEPAVKGTENVLRSCARFPSVKRVILTSSMASVAFNGKPLTPDVVVDETWFSDFAFCVSNKLWYMASKTLAEETAWKFAKENGIDLVTINPGLVIGPLLQPTLNYLCRAVSGQHKWRSSRSTKIAKFVDVRDVAYAHIQALEIPSASGRYCLVGRVTHFSNAVKIAHELYPTLPLPEKCADDKASPLVYEVSKEKAKTLGLDYIPLEVSVKDTIEIATGTERMSRGGDGKVVCVTGGSGYIASWLVKLLLQRGYTVKTTMIQRKQSTCLHLTELRKDFICSRLIYGRRAFDPAVDGCEGVFHTASPISLSPTDNPQVDLIDPALKGTLNVLRSCAKVQSIRRVVLTSSIAACVYSGKPLDHDVAWYPLAKTLAEQAAWSFAKENATDLVVMNPSFVIGPLLQPTLNLTVEMILNLVNGAETYPNGYYSCMDVRDLANAHIQAFEIPSASGRYVATGTERMSRGGDGKVVCVTGGSGYIASWLVKLLLQRGYTVKTTVRDPNDPKKTEHLLALDGAKERLHLFKADLLEEGAFDPVVDGCEGVFHTASPVSLSPTDDPQVDLIDPALKGTLNVLRSCAKVHSIRRVVLTSSLAACIYSGKPLNHDVVIDETWHSDPAICKELKAWYALSKTLAEEAAWSFAKENATDLVIMNPSFVIGPLLQPTLNLSVEMILNLVNGAETYPNAYYRCIDVRDVANAHIQAFEIPSASGRYGLTANVTAFSEVLKIIHENYPTLRLPEKSEESTYKPYQVSKEKAKTLGISFTPLDLTLVLIEFDENLLSISGFFWLKLKTLL